jgi:hypothetical protein
MSPPGYVPQDEVLAAIENLLEWCWAPVRRHDEEFKLCLVCNEVGGHAKDCFVPAVVKWQEAK